jgi:hypothetical protein
MAQRHLWEPQFQEQKSTPTIVKPWRVGKRRSSMDILAAMFAYLVCVAGIVAGLTMSFVVFFSAPGQFSAPPAQAIAMVVTQRPVKTAPMSPLKTIAKTESAGQQVAVAAAAARAVPPPAIAVDARQKPLFSQAHLRRLAEKERQRQLAYRERPSFETRFLHYDD